MITKYDEYLNTNNINLNNNVSMVIEFKKDYEIDIYIANTNEDIDKSFEYTLNSYLALVINHIYVDNNKNEYHPRKTNFYIDTTPLRYFYIQYKLLKLGFKELKNNRNKEYSNNFSKLYKNNTFKTINNLIKTIDVFDDDAIVDTYDKIILDNPNILKNDMFLKTFNSDLLSKYQYLLNASNFDLI